MREAGGSEAAFKLEVYSFRVIREPPRSFGDDFQRPRHRVKHEWIVDKVLILEPSMKLRARRMFS